MLEKAQRSILVFSRLLRKRRRYLSYLSALGISVDLHTEEVATVHAVDKTNNLVMIDLETSEWAMSMWLEELQANSERTEAIFVTNDEQTEMVQTFARPNKESDSQVAYYCADEETLFQNSGIEIVRVLELFASVV